MLRLPLLFWFRLLYFGFRHELGLHLRLGFLEELLLHLSSEGLSSFLLVSHSLFERFSVVLPALKTREAMQLLLVRYLEVVVLGAPHLQMGSVEAANYLKVASPGDLVNFGLEVLTLGAPIYPLQFFI